MVNFSSESKERAIEFLKKHGSSIIFVVFYCDVNRREWVLDKITKDKNKIPENSYLHMVWGFNYKGKKLNVKTNNGNNLKTVINDVLLPYLNKQIPKEDKDPWKR